MKRLRAKVKKMDCETKRILRISLRKLMGVRQRRCLGASFRRNLLVSSVLVSVLSSIELSYYVHRMEYETDVDIDGVKNEPNASKIRPNQKRNEWTKVAKETGKDKKHLKGSKRARLEVDVANKRSKKETVLGVSQGVLFPCQNCPMFACSHTFCFPYLFS